MVRVVEVEIIERCRFTTAEGQELLCRYDAGHPGNHRVRISEQDTCDSLSEQFGCRCDLAAAHCGPHRWHVPDGVSGAQWNEPVEPSPESVARIEAILTECGFSVADCDPVLTGISRRVAGIDPRPKVNPEATIDVPMWERPD